MKALFSFVIILSSLSAVAAEKTGDASLIIVKQIYTSTEAQPLNQAKAQSQALEMCQARGFNSAQALGEEKQLCDRYTGWYECYYRRVEQQYQCLN